MVKNPFHIRLYSILFISLCGKEERRTAGIAQRRRINLINTRPTKKEDKFLFLSLIIHLPLPLEQEKKEKEKIKTVDEGGNQKPTATKYFYVKYESRSVAAPERNLISLAKRIS